MAKMPWDIGKDGELIEPEVASFQYVAQSPDPFDVSHSREGVFDLFMTMSPAELEAFTALMQAVRDELGPLSRDENFQLLSALLIAVSDGTIDLIPDSIEPEEAPQLVGLPPAEDLPHA